MKEENGTLDDQATTPKEVDGKNYPALPHPSFYDTQGCEFKPPPDRVDSVNIYLFLSLSRYLSIYFFLEGAVPHKK
ncbi:unnamed protein product, partial [Mesorhabditis spiculigera]